MNLNYDLICIVTTESNMEVVKVIFFYFDRFHERPVNVVPL